MAKHHHVYQIERVERGSSRGLINILWKCHECGDMYWERDVPE